MLVDRRRPRLRYISAIPVDRRPGSPTSPGSPERAGFVSSLMTSFAHSAIAGISENVDRRPPRLRRTMLKDFCSTGPAGQNHPFFVGLPKLPSAESAQPPNGASESSPDAKAL